MTAHQIAHQLQVWADGQPLTRAERAALDRIIKRLTAPPRPCTRPGCPHEIPPTARPHAKTCSTACRMVLYRARHSSA